MREKDRIRIDQEPDLNATMAFIPSDFGTPRCSGWHYPKKIISGQSDKSGQSVDEFLRKKMERMESYCQKIQKEKSLFDESLEIDKET